MNSKIVVISGGTGLVGSALSKHLESYGYQVRILSRNPKKSYHYFWNLQTSEIDSKVFDKASVIINLSGSGIADKRWNKSRLENILSSRIKSVSLLRNTISQLPEKPQTFIGASAIGFYGSKMGNLKHSEDENAAADTLGKIVSAWEEESLKFENLGLRTVLMRIGIVLSKKGGAMKEMLKPPVLSPVGSGNQFLPIIHIKDLVSAIQYAIDNEHMLGIYNANAVSGISNTAFTKLLAKASGKPYLGIKLPGFILKLALGEMSDLVLKGSTVDNAKLLNTGFRFEFDSAEKAVNDFFTRKNTN